MNAIEIKDLSKTFRGKRGSTVEALKSLSLTIGVGEVFGFLGPNGAGKSTTIKTLMGLIPPSSGTATILGIDVRSHLSRKSVGYLPENPAFYDYLNAEEYLTFVGSSFGMPASAIMSESERCLKLLELWDARKRLVRSYSKGMVQRLGLAQVLLHDPEICILDEPMSGLDPIGRALVKNIIVDLKRRGKSVFFSTHVIADVESVCDRVGIIIEGALKTVEEVQSILSEGITGYRIGFDREQGEGAGEILVARDDLPQFVAQAYAQNKKISLIEPERKDLEQFFLDIVKGKTC